MNRADKILENIANFAKLILIAFVISFYLKEKIVASAVVPTASMEETVMTGSRIFISRVAYLLEDPKRGDIVSFYYPDDEEILYLKRVMGLPGETIEGIDGYVYIDGVKLEENYVKETLDSDFGPFVVPEGCYFMMGDNRNQSWDSRYWENTFVELEDIIGEAKFEFYPKFKILK